MMLTMDLTCLQTIAMSIKMLDILDIVVQVTKVVTDT